jgi:hypothetical protein
MDVDYFDDDDDDCRFTLTHSHSNYDDDCIMNDSQSNIVVDDDFPFEDDTNFDDDDDDYPFVDDSQSNVNDVVVPLPSHESFTIRHTQPHPSTHTGRIESSSSSQMPPPFELSPDTIAQLTVAELSHNPEFMTLHRKVEQLQNTMSVLERQERQERDAQAVKRIMEWRLGVHA